jgi:Na+/H+ antiporter NhaC
MFWLGPDPVAATQFSAFDMFIGGLGAILILLFVGQTARTAGQLRRKGE